MTTPCLQGVANANRDGRTRHVFGLVTDPFVAGVGLRRDDPLEHPRHLVGIGSFEPVASNIRYAKALNPDLHVIRSRLEPWRGELRCVPGQGTGGLSGARDSSWSRPTPRIQPR